MYLVLSININRIRVAMLENERMATTLSTFLALHEDDTPEAVSVTDFGHDQYGDLCLVFKSSFCISY